MRGFRSLPWLSVIVVVFLSNFMQEISSSKNPNEEIRAIVFVILSQPNVFHARQAYNIKMNLTQEAKKMGLDPPVVHLLHEEWPEPGAWTIFPTLARLVSLHSKNASWVLFCEEFTEIQLPQLRNTLRKFSDSKDWFLGHALYDQDATIIHHFAFHDNPAEFAYPDFATGFAVSLPLLKKLAKSWMTDPDHLDFSIDPKHELALYIMRHLNTNLTHIPEFCVHSAPECATSYMMPLPACGSIVPLSEIYFAIKTCKKFHKDRVPVVKSTWGTQADHIEYFSDKVDTTIPTKDLKIPNTDKGHCAKTLAILSYVSLSPDLVKKSWLVIADDDTLISVDRLRKLLSCYDPVDSVALGERYGYSVTSKHGYDYITGGGSMVFSMAVVRQLVDSGRCECPKADTPDDMFLGVCLKRLGIPVTHSPLFHQARPMDYAKDYLSHQRPISFHKHWLIDPIKVYTEWLEEKGSNDHQRLHTEL